MSIESIALPSVETLTLDQKRLNLIKSEKKPTVLVIKGNKDFDLVNLPGDLYTNEEIHQEKLDVMKRLGVTIFEANRIIKEHYTSSK